MLKKLLFLFVIASLLLSACGTLEVSVYQTPTPDAAPQATMVALQQQNAALATAVVTLAPGARPLGPDSSSDDIKQKMLHSAENWSVIWADGFLMNMGQLTHEQVWVDQRAARFRMLSGPQDGSAELFKVSDEQNMLEFDLKTGQRQVSGLPDGVAGQFVPPETPGTAYPNPIGSQLGSRLAGMVFSADYAQNEGSYKILRTEQLVGRETLVVEWTYIQNTLPSWRLWLDVNTGIILKMQGMGKGGGDVIQFEYVINQIIFEPALPSEMFNINPDTLPQFSDAYGQPYSPLVLPTTASATDPLGQVYFFALNPNDEGGARLLRLPASCVTGNSACPMPAEIPLPARTYANNGPALVWSPDGSRAAYLAQVDSPPKLFAFDRESEKFNLIADFGNYDLPIVDLPSWSSDGQWIAFRAQTGEGRDDYFAIRADGTEFKNITASAQLFDQDRPFIVDGWITNNVIVRSGRPGSESNVYLLRVDDGRVKPLFDTFTTKATFYPSPDGSLLAFDEYNYDNPLHTLRVIAPDGSGLRDLATFRTTIYPLVWAPDNFTLAFTVYGESPVNSGFVSASTVYVMTRDGRGLMQVYSGDAISSLAFSPDGSYLLVEDGGQNRIFAVNLQTLEARLIQAPGLNLNDWLRQPSWK
jgi:hypothetical protein